jgi:hypothetical protein
MPIGPNAFRAPTSAATAAPMDCVMAGGSAGYMRLLAWTRNDARKAGAYPRVALADTTAYETSGVRGGQSARRAVRPESGSFSAKAPSPSNA